MIWQMVLQYEAPYDNLDKTNMVNDENGQLLCFIRFWISLSGQIGIPLRTVTLRDNDEPNQI